jgi:hypothetical protein
VVVNKLGTVLNNFLSLRACRFHYNPARNSEHVMRDTTTLSTGAALSQKAKKTLVLQGFSAREGGCGPVNIGVLRREPFQRLIFRRKYSQASHSGLAKISSE